VTGTLPFDRKDRRPFAEEVSRKVITNVTYWMGLLPTPGVSVTPFLLAP
jgi:hypothetical protein